AGCRLAAVAIASREQGATQSQRNCRRQCRKFHASPPWVVVPGREQGMDREAVFTKVVLYTDHDGRAKFREERVPLTEGTAAARLSALLPATGCQLRESPVGFASEFHC